MSATVLEEICDDWSREHTALWERRMADREKLARAQRLLADLRLEHHDLGVVTSILADVLNDRDKTRLSSPHELRTRHLQLQRGTR